MAIYTRKGDKGLAKDSLKIQAIGTIDEVNSFLGVASFGMNLKEKKILEEIQKNLFTIGAILAGANLRFYASKTKKLERQIDKLEKELPPLKNFILPGGSLEGGRLHFARTLVRRAERVIVVFSREEKVKPQILVYLNRLSDFLFVLARKVNYDKGIREEIWKGG